MSDKLVTTQETTPDQLLAMAVDKNLDIDKLAKLMELQRQWKADQAREAFFDAITEFQKEAPEIRKNNKAEFDTRNGGKTSYQYADLASVVRAVREVEHRNGLSHRWEFKDDGQMIVVSCHITHVQGHTETTTMSASADTSGSKNAIQARGSTIEYLKRYTLIGALGLSTTDTDNDGHIPEIDIDILHDQFMRHYNQLIQLDPTATKFHPDNWKLEPNARNYVKAIGAIREKLGNAIPKY